MSKKPQSVKKTIEDDISSGFLLRYLRLEFIKGKLKSLLVLVLLLLTS